MTMRDLRTDSVAMKLYAIFRTSSRLDVVARLD
jgi:hypothetical protein